MLQETLVEIYWEPFIQDWQGRI